MPPQRIDCPVGCNGASAPSAQPRLLSIGQRAGALLTRAHQPFSRRSALVLLVALVIWSFTDVRSRAHVDPHHPTIHRTDFTVYTEAGAAFFDGRDPYQVTNARGWRYLYLPPFALLVAPLSHLAPEAQAILWFWISVAAAWCCWIELRRLERRWRRHDSAELPSRVWPHSAWPLLAVATVALPTLNSLQRGQVGLVQLYLTLVAFRLWIERRSRWTLLASGAIFAQAILLKLTPIVPVACLAALEGMRWWRHASSTTAWRCRWTGAGLLVGAAVALLIVPGALVGWHQNVQHLRTWWNAVGLHTAEATHDSFAGDSHSARNQSLANALWLCGNAIDRLGHGEPLAPVDADSHRPMAMDALAPRLVIDAARLLVLVFTFLAVMMLAVMARSCDARAVARGTRAKWAVSPAAWSAASPTEPTELYEALCFALGCSASLLLPSIARVHYFMALLPALLWLPPQLARWGFRRMAITAAIAPLTLVVLHYTLMRFAGTLGLLGIGIALWHLVIALVILRHPLEQAGTAADQESTAWARAA